MNTKNLEPELQKEIPIGAILKMNRDLTERNKSLAQFVYAVSHDLRSPLKSILGLINVVKMENDLHTKSKLLNMMEGRVQNLECYIKDVTNMSQNSRLGIIRKKLYFRDVLDEILGNLDHCDNYNKINFRRRFSTNAMIETDPVRLKIILNNLITNAMKFHVFDGRKDPIVDISFEYSGKENRITVSDNGRGIEEQYLDRIFDMFFRSSSICEGSGLGLYITKETVEKLKGTISVKSKIYEGTHFIVILPNFAA